MENNLCSAITKIQFRRNQRGATMLEYAVMGAVIAGTLYLGFNSFGTSLGSFFTNLGGWAESQSPQGSSGSSEPNAQQ